MTERRSRPAPTGARSPARGRARRGRRLLEAAEQVFAELGYHDASIVKITEAAGVAQGTFYLYFASKKEIFDELVRDLNRRVRHAMQEAPSQGATRVEAELLGFRALLPLHGRAPGALPDHPPGGVRLARDLHVALRRALRAATSTALREAMDAGEIARVDPEVAAWALMGDRRAASACAGSSGATGEMPEARARASSSGSSARAGGRT